MSNYHFGISGFANQLITRGLTRHHCKMRERSGKDTASEALVCAKLCSLLIQLNSSASKRTMIDQQLNEGDDIVASHAPHTPFESSDARGESTPLNTTLL